MLSDLAAAQPGITLSLPSGDNATISLFGAQVLSWSPAGGAERLYLSPRAVFDGKSAIRGGIPICWPQFNQRGPLPKHGFVRNMPWTPVPEATDGSRAVLVLRDDEATRALWPHAFEAKVSVTLTPGVLLLEFAVTNTGDTAFDFTLALHSYLRTDDVSRARLMGLDGVPFWDAVHDTHPAPLPAGQALTFDGETDRVYQAPGAGLMLRDGLGQLDIANGDGFAQTVVWNPAAELSARLADMPDDGWRHMLCVEAAAIDVPVTLLPGSRWAGSQRLSVPAA